MVDAVCTAVDGSARTGRELDAGIGREDRSSDAYNVGDTRKSFSEKDDDSILHTYHAIGCSTSCHIAKIISSQTCTAPRLSV